LNNKRILGFDFGMKRIGTAFAQTISMQAKPLKTLRARDGVPNWQELDALIKEWQPHELVVGLPLNLDGSMQLVTFAAKKYAKKLRNKYNLMVHEEDERLTTVEARALMFEEGGFRAIKKAEIDSIAAVIITEQWLSGLAHSN